MSIVTIYTGKTVNDIDKQCLTCNHFDNVFYYCRSPFKNQKIRYGFAPKCKMREEIKDSEEK